MKTKLLSFILITVLFTSISNAQTKTWDFGNDDTTWPVSTGIGSTQMIVDNLGLYPIASNTNFGAVNSNNTTFPDGFTAARRFQMNGAGYPSGPFMAMPTQRFLFLDVSGACTIKVWFRPGSNGAARTIYVSNGTIAVGQATSNTGDNLDATILTATIPAAGRYYIYGDTACNLYKVTVTGATVSTTTLASNDFEVGSLVDVFSNGKQISIANVISNTQIEVYNMTGALVKSFNTTSDTSFEFLTTGLYIVNVKSAEGQKAVKVAIQ